MVVDEIRIASSVIVRIHDDHIENPAQIEKRLADLSRIMTNSYKRRVADGNCITVARKTKPRSK